MWIYIVLGILALLILLLLLPVVVYVKYDETVIASIRFGVLRFQLLPKKDKPKNLPKKKKLNKQKAGEPSSGRFKNLVEKHGVLGTVQLMVSAAGTLSKGALRLLKGARIRHLNAEIRITGKDAAEAATTYGQVCGVLYPFLGAVDQHMKFVRPQLNLYCDYVRDKPLIKGQAAIYVSLYHAVGTALYILKELIIKNMKIKVVKQNERK